MCQLFTNFYSLHSRNIHLCVSHSFSCPTLLQSHVGAQLIIIVAMPKPLGSASISEVVVVPQSERRDFIDLGDPFLDDYHQSRFNPYCLSAEHHETSSTLSPSAREGPSGSPR